MFQASTANDAFGPVAGNPLEGGERACLFQHRFGDSFYGYQCRLDRATEKWQMEVLVVPLKK